MDAGTTRNRNRRGQGELLRREIIDAALQMLNELGDDEALSLRAVAREVGIAATSVYIHFSDRDELVFAALEQSTADLLRDLEQAEASGGDDPVRYSARESCSSAAGRVSTPVSTRCCTRAR